MAKNIFMGFTMTKGEINDYKNSAYTIIIQTDKFPAMRIKLKKKIRLLHTIPNCSKMIL